MIGWSIEARVRSLRPEVGGNHSLSRLTVEFGAVSWWNWAARYRVYVLATPGRYDTHPGSGVLAIESSGPDYRVDELGRRWLRVSLVGHPLRVSRWVTRWSATWPSRTLESDFAVTWEWPLDAVSREGV